MFVSYRNITLLILLVAVLAAVPQGCTRQRFGKTDIDFYVTKISPTEKLDATSVRRKSVQNFRRAEASYLVAVANFGDIDKDQSIAFQWVDNEERIFQNVPGKPISELNLVGEKGNNAQMRYTIWQKFNHREVGKFKTGTWKVYLLLDGEEAGKVEFNLND